MPTMFDEPDRGAILARIERMSAASERLWGTMTPAQMLAHCSIGFEAATGARTMGQSLLGRIVGPLIRGFVLSDRPWKQGVPTDAQFIVSDERDFEAERSRLRERIEEFTTAGPEAAGRHPHVFFGRLSGDQWGILMYKHMDHHLRQFGA